MNNQPMVGKAIKILSSSVMYKGDETLIDGLIVAENETDYQIQIAEHYNLAISKFWITKGSLYQIAPLEEQK